MVHRMDMRRRVARQGAARAPGDLPTAAGGDPEAVAAVREAQRLVAAARAWGAAASRSEADRSSERLERFDQAAAPIVVLPRVVGG